MQVFITNLSKFTPIEGDRTTMNERIAQDAKRLFLWTGEEDYDDIASRQLQNMLHGYVESICPLFVYKTGLGNCYQFVDTFSKYQYRQSYCVGSSTVIVVEDWEPNGENMLEFYTKAFSCYDEKQDMTRRTQNEEFVALFLKARAYHLLNWLNEYSTGMRNYKTKKEQTMYCNEHYIKFETWSRCSQSSLTEKLEGKFISKESLCARFFPGHDQPASPINQAKKIYDKKEKLWLDGNW